MSTDVRESMDPQLYIEALDVESDWVSDAGDQCLILPDIMACFKDCQTIALPYASSCRVLTKHIMQTGREVLFGASAITGEADAAYWGTPTIVNDRPLFEKSVAADEHLSEWTKEHERYVTRAYTADCLAAGVDVIVTGLGSGDITVKERLADMGGGHVVSHKMFGEFEDWVLMRRLR